jgi:hypothetical protein
MQEIELEKIGRELGRHQEVVVRLQALIKPYRWRRTLGQYRRAEQRRSDKTADIEAIVNDQSVNLINLG